MRKIIDLLQLTLLIGFTIGFLTPHTHAANLFLQDQILMPADYTERHVTKSSLETKLSNLVNKASKGKARYVSFFKGPGSLIGIILEGNTKTGKKKIAWNPAGTELLIFGTVIDQTGTDQTRIATEAFLKEPFPSKPTTLNLKDMRSFLFKEGKGDKTKDLYIVIDPECPTCDRILQKLIEPSTRFKENVRVLLVPIARTKIGRSKAAFLLKYGYPEGIIKHQADQEKLRATLYEAITSNTDKLTAQIQAIKTPMLVHNGEIITSFNPFIISSSQDSDPVR